MLMHYNPAHRWYFLDRQMESDVIAIRHTDSRGYEIPCRAPYQPTWAADFAPAKSRK